MCNVSTEVEQMNKLTLNMCCTQDCGARSGSFLCNEHHSQEPSTGQTVESITSSTESQLPVDVSRSICTTLRQVVGGDRVTLKMLMQDNAVMLCTTLHCTQAPGGAPCCQAADATSRLPALHMCNMQSQHSDAVTHTQTCSRRLCNSSSPCLRGPSYAQQKTEQCRTDRLPTNPG